MVSNFGKKWNLGVIWAVLSFIYISIFIYVRRVFIWRGIMFLFSNTDKPHQLQINHWMLHPWIKSLVLIIYWTYGQFYVWGPKDKIWKSQFYFVGLYWGLLGIFHFSEIHHFKNLLSLTYFSCKRMMYRSFC